jgi:hypothetical protein
MDKLTQKIYDEYKSQIDLSGYFHSVHYEMTTALLNKELKQQWELLQQATDQAPPPIRKYLEAKVDALITIIAELTIIAMELFLQEPEYIEDEVEDD